MAPSRPIQFVASGFPSPADDFAEQALDLNAYLIKHPAATFFMRSAGNANSKYGIFEGDILIIDRSLQASPNKLAAIIFENEFKVTDYKSMQEILKEESGETEFWGVITGIVRKF